MDIEYVRSRFVKHFDGKARKHLSLTWAYQSDW